MQPIIPQTITANGKLLSFEQPRIMGILNITNDSFFSHSRHDSLYQAQQTIEDLIAAGADIIDIGGMSTKPFAVEIPETEEIQKTASLIKWCRASFPHIFISIDTYRTQVLQAAIDEGVDIINDISAGKMDENFLDVVAKSQLPYIAMHMQGTPKDMQIDPTYENVLTDLLDFFILFKKQLNDKGIYQIMIDPGFGFGKSLAHNYHLLKNLPAFSILELPILAGLSRKGMIWKTLDSNPEDALFGTISANMIALMNGANLLRVHDVKAAKDIIKIFNQYQDTP